MKSIVNKKYNIINEIRELIAILFIVWSLNPMANFYSRYVNFILLFLWLLIAFISDTSTFIKTIQNKGFIIALFFPIFLSIRSIISLNEINATNFMITLIYFMFWYYYKQQNMRAMKKIFTSGLLYTLAIAVYSINALYQDGRLARYLAQSDQSLTIQYAHPLLANFTYIYSLTLIVIYFVAILSISNKSTYKFGKRVCILIMILLFFLVTIMAQYMIAILTIIIFSFIAFNTTRKRSYKILILQLIVFIFGLFMFINLENILYYVSTLTNSTTLQTRLIDLANIFGGFGVSSTEALSLRLKLYSDSIQTFMSHPIIGVGNTVYRMGGLVGGHSELLDNLAYHGLLGSSLWFAAIYINYKMIASKFSKQIKKSYTVIFTLYITHSLLNLSYFIPNLVVLYLLIPFGLMLYNDKHYEQI